MADRRRREEERRFVDRDRVRAEAARTENRHRSTEAELPRPRHDRPETRRMEEMDTRMEDTRPTAQYAISRAPDPRMDARMDDRMDTRMDLGDDYQYGAQRPAREYVTSPPGGARPQYIPERGDEYIRNQIYEIEPRSSSANYAEFFLSGDGINREVLQNEITKYLGSDAVSRPFTHNDGRRGFLIKAYRAPTQAMVRSIRDASAAYENDQRRRQRQGYNTVPYEEYASTQDQRPQGLDRRAGYPQGAMDLDDDRVAYRNAPGNNNYPVDPREYRDAPIRNIQQVDRHGPVTTTAGYQPEAAYATYTLGTVQPPGMQQRPYDVPRSMTGGRTPPQAGARVVPIGYESSAGYPAVTSAIRQPGVAATYESGQQTQVTGYPGYQEREIRDRHAPPRR